MLHEFIEGRDFPGVEDHGGERGFTALIVGIHYGGNSAASDPVAGAFVGNGKPPASRAHDATGSVAAIRDGTGAGDRDHARTSAESGFKSDLSITDNFDADWRHSH